MSCSPTNRHADARPDQLHARHRRRRYRSADVLRWGLLCADVAAPTQTNPGGATGDAPTNVAGANPLDAALMTSTPAHALAPELAGYERLGALPFDHDRAMNSVLVRDSATGIQTLIVKGSPEAVTRHCRIVPTALSDALEAEFAAGHRVIAVATRSAPDLHTVTPTDETDLDLIGLLVFLDPPNPTPLTPLRASLTSGSPSRSSPVTTRPSPKRSAPTSDCPPVPRSPGPTSTPSTTRPRRRDRHHHRLRPDHPGTESAHRPGSSAHRWRRRVPRRRRQRRARPARRRRRHLRRHRHRCGQGCRRRDPAREGPRRTRRRRGGRPPDLRQHDQVRADGHLQQLREHVQRRWRLDNPAVPADAALADPAQQPALRHQPTRHPHRQRR